MGTLCITLLDDPLIGVRLTDGTTSAMSLPDVFGAMSADHVAAFPALRSHQRHAWHAFLAQLGAVALHRAGQDVPPRTAVAWRALLRDLTTEFGDDAPWHLTVDDPARPAFMQSPAPNGLSEYRGRVVTPDDLDLLVTAKNHDVKQAVATEGSIDDWLFALIDLQTMAGFLGAGNYGIARMNGGFSARPCLGLAPAAGGLGAHLIHDLRRMLAGRATLLDTYPEYFNAAHGLALVWLEPWDGANSLDLRSLDPYFIEICRRVRLRVEGSVIVGWTAASKAARIAAKDAHGNLGDFWTPGSMKVARCNLYEFGPRGTEVFGMRNRELDTSDAGLCPGSANDTGSRGRPHGLNNRGDGSAFSRLLEGDDHQRNGKRRAPRRTAWPICRTGRACSRTAKESRP